MKNVIIKRSKWQRGGALLNKQHHGLSTTTLWHKDKKCGCCLGHVLHQAHGMTFATLDYKGTPSSLAMSLGKKNPLVKLRKSSPSEQSYIIYDNNLFSEKAMLINDNEDSDYTDAKREYDLADMGRGFGYNITFED